jgi:hypothetical protein
MYPGVPPVAVTVAVPLASFGQAGLFNSILVISTLVKIGISKQWLN